MAYELKMPQLGLTMEEGTLSKWLKHEGDTVKAGEVVAEITTDKLTNELTSEQDGVMLKLVAQEGDVIPVKGTLAWIGQAGEAVPGAVPAAVAAAVPQAPAAPAAAPAGGKKSVIVIGGCHPCRAAGCGGHRRGEAVPGRHLPECGLHSY